MKLDNDLGTFGVLGCLIGIVLLGLVMLLVLMAVRH